MNTTDRPKLTLMQGGSSLPERIPVQRQREVSPEKQQEYEKALAKAALERGPKYSQDRADEIRRRYHGVDPRE